MRKEQLRGDESFVVHDFLTVEEFIAGSEGRGYGDATITTDAGPVMFPELRNVTVHGVLKVGQNYPPFQSVATSCAPNWPKLPANIRRLRPQAGS